MRPKIYLSVAGAHILVLYALFIAGILPSCSHEPKPEPVAVNLRQNTSLDNERDTEMAAEENTQKESGSTDDSASSQNNDVAPTSEGTTAINEESRESPESTRDENWQARSAEDIRQNANVKPIKETEQQSNDDGPRLDSSELRTKLTEELKKQSLALTVKDSRDKSRNSKRTRKYYERLTRYLYKKWEQPAASAINQASPRMKVQLKIDGHGKLLSWNTLKPSRDPRMDASVKNMLKDLKKVPQLASYGIDQNSLTLDVVFELN